MLVMVEIKVLVVWRFMERDMGIEMSEKGENKRMEREKGVRKERKIYIGMEI